MPKYPDSTSGYIGPAVGCIVVGALIVCQSRFSVGWNRNTTIGIGLTLIGILLILYSAWDSRRIEQAEKSTIQNIPSEDD